MKLTQVDEIPTTLRGRPGGASKYLSVIEAFMESDMAYAKVDCDPDKARVAHNGFYRIIIQHGIDGVKVVLRGSEVYLAREE